MESYLAKAGKAKGILRKGTEVVGTLLPVAFDVMKSFTGIDADTDKVSGAVNAFLSIKNSIYILYRESITGYFQHIIKKDGNFLIKNRTYVN